MPCPTPLILSDIHPDDALERLQQLQGLMLNPCPGTSMPLLGCAIAEMAALCDGYAEGSVGFRPSPLAGMSIGTSPISCGTPSNQSRRESSSKPKYNDPTREGFDLQGLSVQPISAMNWKLLFQQMPCGTIKPPAPRLFFEVAGPVLPAPTGWVNATSFSASEPELRPFFTLPGPGVQSKGEISLELPNRPEVFGRNNRVLPLPFGMEPAAIRAGVKVAPPTPHDPDCWRTDIRTETIAASLKVSDLQSPHLLCDVAAISPSPAEMRYWRKVLAIPSELQERLRAACDTGQLGTVFGLVDAWMRQNVDGRTNFRYACHDAFGQFVAGNSAYLPLIMSVLKLGHCDLLTWYQVALLRAYGVPAWGQRVFRTTHDGSGLNVACGHMLTKASTERGQLYESDPSTVDFDKTYHPEILSKSEIRRLSTEFGAAKTFRGKLAVLERFARRQAAAQGTASSNSAVIEDLQFLAGIAGFGLERSDLSDKLSYLNRGGVASPWNLPGEMNLATFRALLRAEKKSSDAVFNFDDYASPEKTVVTRMELQWLLKAAKDVRFPLRNFLGHRDARWAFGITGKGERPSSSLVEFDWTLTTIAPFDATLALTSSRAGNLSNTMLNGTIDDQPGGTFSDATMYPLAGLSIDHTFSADFIGELSRGNVTIVDESKPDTPPVKHFNVSTRQFLPIPNDRTSRRVRWLDAVKFYSKVQSACLDPAKRDSLFSELPITAEQLRTFVLASVKLNMGRYRNVLSVVPDEDCRKSIAFKIAPFNLNAGAYTHFSAAFRNAIQLLDSAPGSGSVPLAGETRPYASGDDFRRIDWAAWARSDTYMVRQTPVLERDKTSSLYVLFDGPSDGPYWPGNFEMIRILCAEVRKGREVFVGLQEKDVYFRLPGRGLSELDIWSALVSPKFSGSLAPFLSNGRLPPNLLVVSEQFGTLAAMKYLFGEHGNVGVFWLASPSAWCYPQVTDQWVRDGYDPALVRAQTSNIELLGKSLGWSS